MYLKQLTLRGFKSFASATTLNFEPGITCIVGPNGSGKSNVVDALSWVMGEQGAKSLRGGKMEDVIFAGTAKRAPLGRAEVQLTIDNSDGALPIEYSEVTITRTMFRSGGSEYAINGSPARLLDVTELLSDSGIGREMHVIVGQGQLDAILQATPESRRGFIEEAAGVLKHRKRKEKAERKLEGTKANLERLQDLTGELQRQLKPLGRQAETARRAAIIQADVRDAKARLLADDLAGARRAMAEAEADEAAALAARARLEAQLAESTAAERTAEHELAEAARVLEAAQEDWYAARSLADRVSATISIAAERMRMATAQPALDVPIRDPEELEAEAADIRRREADLAGRVAEAQAALETASAARSAAEERHSDEEKAYAARLRALSDRREGKARLAGQLASLASRLEASLGEQRRLQQRLAETRERQRAASDEYRLAELRMAGLGASESRLDEAYEQAAAAAKTLRLECERLEAAEVDIAQARAGAEGRLDALRLAAQRDGTTELLSEDQLLGRLGDLIQVEPGWEQAIAAALGSAAEAVVAVDLDGAIAAAERLRERDGGWATVLAANVDSAPAMSLVTASQPVAGLVARLLRGIVVVEDLDRARDIVAADPEVLVVTRRGERLSSWLVEGGSERATSLLALNARILEAEEEVARLASKAERNRFQLTVARQEAAAAEGQVAAALDELHDSDAQLTAVAEGLAAARQAQATAAREATRIAASIVEVERSCAGLEERRAELQLRVDAEADDDLAEPDPEARDEWNARARAARQAETEARLALRSLEEQSRSIAGRAESLLRAAANERRARAKAEARAERLRRESAVAATVHEAAVTLGTQTAALIERAAAARAAAEDDRQRAEAATVAARQLTKEVAGRLDDLVRGAHRDELVRIEHQVRFEQLAERAQAELGMEAEPLLAEYGPDIPVPVLGDGAVPDEPPAYKPFDRAEQAKRLRAAERALSALGRINPLALEEFEALKARHAFLAEQLQDLRQTRSDLMALIDDVENRVREVFEAAWRDVEAAFGKVFARLFPGGEGRLVLTDPGDWLATGVDVEARPAGKQVKRLSLLSGGERSLVAVAFLVSLFIARPSPFYILDEVEAALDDANLGRLLAIYEELRVTSQLLVITHQKRTMEIADSLYGVTMKGDGISKVVSQRVTESD